MNRDGVIPARAPADCRDARLFGRAKRQWRDDGAFFELDANPAFVGVVSSLNDSDAEAVRFASEQSAHTSEESRLHCAALAMIARDGEIIRVRIVGPEGSEWSRVSLVPPPRALYLGMRRHRNGFFRGSEEARSTIPRK